MNAPEIGSNPQPFPVTRPEVVVTPSPARAFAVRSRLLPGFGVPLEPGKSAWMGWYDPPEWKLTSVSHMLVSREAEVHGVNGLEIEMLEWESAEPVWKAGHTHYARLTDSTVQWLATSNVRKGKRVLYTFLDEGFEADWGESPRLFEETSRLTLSDDGTYRLQAPPAEGTGGAIGAGMFRVRVGSREFICLRVIDLRASHREPDRLERDILCECYYTESDQLVLFRRYNGRLWAIESGGRQGRRPWDERFPDHSRIVINGAVFVHWYDCLTDASVSLP
jgi:hypothetical protein